MAATETLQISSGYKAPDFRLPDAVSGKTLSLNQLKGDRATMVVFICNHCPYVLHVIDVVVEMAAEYLSKGVKFIAISSNDVDAYPQDAPDKMAGFAKERQFPFPYLYDESQDVAKAYHAACTPDFSLFNKNMECFYHGQFDDSRPGNQKPVTGHDVRTALNALLEGKSLNAPQLPGIGCGIKWKPENS